MPDTPENTPKIFKHRVIALLNREELEFLDKLGKDSLFSCGHKLSYNQIIRALVNYAMETGLSGKDAKTMEALKEKLLKKLAIVIKPNEQAGQINTSNPIKEEGK
jgi:hypothetical protein